MNKKIIAVALAILTMVAFFTACGKKHKTTEINGKEYILLTDADGNTVMNGDNQLVALVTDENGEVLTFEDGENQTRYITAYGDALGDGVAYGENGSFKIRKGWSSDDNGNIFKDETEEQCYIKLVKVADVTEEDSFAKYFVNLDSQNKTIVAPLEAEGYKTEITKSNCSITMKALDCTKYVYKFIDADGKVSHYAENYYFEQDDVIYKIEYACVNGVGYEEDFNCQAYLDGSFVFKNKN